MVRAVFIEDKLLTSKHEALQRTVAFETGLLIAHLGSKGDTLLRFVPTPKREDDKPGAIDPDWVLSHATQVAHMLPGGIGVLGCYALAANAKLSAVETKLQPVLAALAKRLPSTSEVQSVLLLLPSDAKKPVCRVCSAGGAKLQPTELKTSQAPPQLVCFDCNWQVDLLLTLEASSDTSHEAQLAKQLEEAEGMITEALATVGGQMPAAGQLVSQLPATAGSLAQPHAVTFFAASPSAALPARSNAAALVRIVGVVHGRALALPKSDVGAAVDDLRRDVGAALRARVPLLLEQLAEDADEDEEAEGGGDGFDLSTATAHALPRRVHLAVGSDGLSLCDYLGADEEPSDVRERFTELLGMTPLIREGEELTEEDLGPEAAALVAELPPPRAKSTPAAQPAATSAAKPAPAACNAEAADATGAAKPAASNGMLLGVLAAVAFAALAAAVAMSAGGGSAEQTGAPLVDALGPDAGAAAVATDGVEVGANGPP